MSRVQSVYSWIQFQSPPQAQHSSVQAPKETGISRETLQGINNPPVDFLLTPTSEIRRLLPSGHNAKTYFFWKVKETILSDLHTRCSEATRHFWLRWAVIGLECDWTHRHTCNRLHLLLGQLLGLDRETCHGFCLPVSLIETADVWTAISILELLQPYLSDIVFVLDVVLALWFLYLKHLFDLLSGEVDVEFVQELQDLADA